jgi:Cu+-exporting ATPase
MLRAMAISPDAKAQLAIDPVCGMTVDPATAEHRSEFGGKTYHFCSAGCKVAFDDHPDRYLGASPAHGHSH